MLAALKIDAAELARTQPAALRDLQRVCSLCDSKRRCRTELAAGDAARTYEASAACATASDAAKASSLRAMRRAPTRASARTR
jgi:hypothetical protein